MKTIQSRSVRSNAGGKKAKTGGDLLIPGIVLTFIMPPIGIIVLIFAIIKMVSAADEKSSRSASEQDWRKTVGSAYEGGRQIKDRVVHFMTAEDAKEKPFHSHSPIEYSYDNCALEKRLEQLDSLYKAGLYTKEQYAEARAKAKAMGRR